MRSDRTAKLTQKASCILVILLGLNAAPITIGAGQEQSSPDFRAALTAQLLRQEKFIRSMSATLDRKVEPTAASDIPLIQEFLKERGEEQTVHLVISREWAAANDRTMKWWRDGEKERQDDMSPGDTSPGRQQVFDGKVVRTLDDTGSEKFGSLDRPDTAHWSDTIRITPDAFLSEYAMRPYSAMVARSRELAVKEILEDNGARRKVSFEDPDVPGLRFILYFDASHKLISRQIYLTGGAETSPRVWEQYDLSDYREIKDPSGEVLWFPYKLIVHYYAGSTKDGRQVQWKQETYQIRDATINQPISSDIFALKFPQGTKVWDGMGGMGWLDKEQAALWMETIDTMGEEPSRVKSQIKPNQSTAFSHLAGVSPSSDTPYIAKVDGPYRNRMSVILLIVSAVVGVGFLVAKVLLRTKKKVSDLPS